MENDPAADAGLDGRASDLIDAMLAFRWACDVAPAVSARALGDVCHEAADLVAFCLARSGRRGAAGDEMVSRAFGHA